MKIRVITVITIITLSLISLAGSQKEEKLQIGVLKKVENCKIKSKKDDTVFMFVLLNKL